MNGRVHARLSDDAIGALFGQLLEDGKTIVSTEVRLARAGVSLRISRAKGGLVLAVLGLAVIHLSLIAGAVMLALALAVETGPLYAGLIVIVAGSAVAAVLARAAIGRIRLGFAPLPGSDAA